MKKTFSGSKFASKPLRFEALETRNLLAADPTLLRAFSSEEAAGNVVVETADAQLDVDSVIPVSPSEQSDVQSAGTLDSDTASWYALTTGVDPSADEQELLEQINRLRMDPQGELDRIFSYYDDETLTARNSLVADAIKLNSYPKDSIEDFLEMWSDLEVQAPLAFNSSLETAATSHSTYMKAKNDVSHKCSGEDSLTTRVSKAGFVSGLTSDGTIAISENIGGCFSARGDFSVASYMLAAFAVDWGVPAHEHLDAMMNAAYSEIGVSVMQTSKSIGPYIVTCDFGTSSEGARTDGAYLLGVVYDDADSDLFYDAGEGLGNVSIEIARNDGSEAQTVTFSSWDSGGYQIFLLNGSYTITVSGDGFSTSITKSVTIRDGVNAKVDFRTDEAGATPPVVDLNGNEDGTSVEVVFVEGSDTPTEALAASGLVINDADSTYLYGAKIHFGERPDGENETIDISVSGTELTASFDDQMGTITISGTGTLAEYEDVIASLKYFNSSETCDLSSDHKVLISVYDGVFWSEEAELVISITPTNLPNMTVHEMSTYEGDEGTKVVSFVVELDSPARLDVSFNFNVVEGGTALNGYDYVLSKGDPITIATGETTATIECYVNGNYDALKPEGLAAVDGGFEKPFVYFDLEIVDVENAYLTNVDSLVRGTIYDDDSPIVIGTTNAYSLANALSTENGDRRYVFSVTPESSGYYSWSTDSLGLPEGMTISVRENSLESDVVASSVVVADGGRVQWFADPDVEYWITIESSADVALIDARLLEITDEKVVLIDPLLGDTADSLVELMWNEDSLDLSVGNWTWNFDSDFWNGSTLKTTHDDVEFSTELRPHSVNSVEASEDSEGDYSLAMDDVSMVISGIFTYRLTGNDQNEELTLVGTSGVDNLSFSGGSGTFQTSDGLSYSFNGVNKLTIDGKGGEDYAYIQDSASNDQLETYNNSLTMNGDGYTITASNFPKSFVVFNRGGNDSYISSDSGDDVQTTLASGSSITTGSYAVETTEEGTEEIVKTDVLYSRTVIGVESTVLAPTSSIGAVVLDDSGASNLLLNAAIGSLTSFDQKTSRTTSITKAKNLTVTGVHPFTAENFVLSLPEEYAYSIDGDNVMIVDSSNGWELHVPKWSFTAEAASATLDREIEKETLSFSFYDKFDSAFIEDESERLYSSLEETFDAEDCVERLAEALLDEEELFMENSLVSDVHNSVKSESLNDSLEVVLDTSFVQNEEWMFD